MSDSEVLDPDVLRDWLTEELAVRVVRVGVELMPQGHSNGAWRLDVETGDGVRRMVLKAPREPSVVHDMDPRREGRLVAALHRAGAPVPAVLAVDPGTRVVGRP